MKKKNDQDKYKTYDNKIQKSEKQLNTNNFPKSKKRKILIFRGDWKNGYPCINKDYILNFENFVNFNFYNIFDKKNNLIFFDKGIFFGEINFNKKFHGKGTCYYNNNFQYKGFFENGIWHGKGEISYDTKLIYKGEFNQGVFDGYGYLYKENGNVFIGEFKNGKLEGNGKIMIYNGSIFDGSFKDDERHGKGKTTFQDKSILEGNYINGKIHGNASLSKYDSNGKIRYFRRKYKKGKLKSETIVKKKHKIKPSCCLRFTI